MALGRARRVLGKVLTVAAAVALVAGLTAVWTVASDAMSATPNDPLFPQQWALVQANSPPSWAVSTGAGVTIGIVDTGIDLAHHELGPKLVPGGAATCINTNGDPNACKTGPGAGQDDEGHGSFVSGEAAAVTNDGYQIAAVAPDARLVVAKAMDNQGNGAISDIFAGIEWVTQHGAQVVNLSLGPETSIIGGGDQALGPALEWAWSQGVVPVIASGNTNVLHVLGSSGYGNVDAVVVGATDRNGQEASYSSPLAGTKWA
ncbi:MAG TPA: S8 family serine peptidase, partial [Acidimicrobiales bacterium]